MFEKNLLTKMFGIRFPIIQAPMSPITSADLVSAVSNGGGLGTIAGARMTGKQLREEIRRVRTLTKNPFGVNLFVPPRETVRDVSIVEIDRIKSDLNEFVRLHRLEHFPLDFRSIEIRKPENLFDEQIEIVAEEKIDFLSFTFGFLTEKVVDRLKKKSIRLIGTATTVKEAILLKETGCDAVCLQGSEAGGHRGSFLTDDRTTIELSTISLESLLSQVRCFIDENSFPLIAAGGIMDGRSFLNALISGASAVQLGTRFLTCFESEQLVPEAHRNFLLRAKENVDRIRPTVLTRSYTGKPARGIRTAITDFFSSDEQREKNILPWLFQSQLVSPLSQHAAKTNRIDFMQLWAGQNYVRCQRQSAAQILQQIVEEARDTYRQRKISDIGTEFDSN